MDVVALGLAKADAARRYAFTSPRLAAFHRAMDYGTGDLNFLVLGDSTGDGPTRFVRLLANKYAQQYPTWTVIYDAWSDGTKTFPGGNRVTVQTGTNGRTLYIRNASVAGQVIAYARDNIVPLANGAGFNPDFILFNYGHNSPQLGDAYRPLLAETINRYRNRWPKAPVVICTQNPRDISDWPTEYAQDEGRQQATYEFAASDGLIVADVNQVFHEYGNFATDLLNSDGLHPNDSAGSPLWAQTVWDTIKPTGVTVFPGHHPQSNRIWVPAGTFYAVDGTPALTAAYGQQGWALDPAADESVACSVDIPTAWAYQNIYTVMTAQTAGAAGNQRVMVGHHMYVGTNTGTGGSVTLGAWSQSGNSTAGAVYVPGRTAVDVLWDRIQLGSSPVALKVTRDADHASDTYAGDVLFLGLMIERAY